MISVTSRTFATVAFGLAVCTLTLQGQDRARYREFVLGSDLPSVATQANVSPSAARTIHQRPALIQELDWRPRYVTTSSATPEDPVRRVVFVFFDNQLSRVLVDYDPYRTAGMTDADLIDAISATYGPPVKPAPRNPRAVQSREDQEFVPPVAQWAGAGYAVELDRAPYALGFRMTVRSPELDERMRTAEAQALQLDVREAPQREVARQKKETEDAQASQDKARGTNKPAFRP